MEPQTPREVLAAVRRMEDELDAARRASRARERELEDLRASVAAEQALERRQVVEDLERVVDLIGAGWRDTGARLSAIADEVAALRRMAAEVAELRRAVEDLGGLRRLADELGAMRDEVRGLASLRRAADDLPELRRVAADVTELRRFADEAARAVRGARLELRLGGVAEGEAGPPNANGRDTGRGRPPGG